MYLLRQGGYYNVTPTAHGADTTKALPPLVLHAFLTGKADVLAAWLARLEQPPDGCVYLNFLASHADFGMSSSA